jgi:hypothetical protein
MMNLKKEIYSKFNDNVSWIKDNTIYLTKFGSEAYGTNTINSDLDVRGVCIPPKEYYLGSKKFEQAELNNPDVVIFELSKFFKLAEDCNPNALEILFVDKGDILYIDSLGKDIINNRELFLSKKVFYTMCGYAKQQLHRIRSHKRWLLSPPTTKPTRSDFKLPESPQIDNTQMAAVTADIQKELDKFQFDFIDDLEESKKIEIRSTMTQMLAQLKISADDHWMAAARKIGLNDNFIEIMQKERMYTNAKREWDQYQNWKKTRNPARSALEEKFGYDTKHAYHLVRLMRMCREILATGKVIVKRPDREELLAIRNGAWSYDKLLEFASKEEASINELYATSNLLPKFPDKSKIDKLCIELVEKSLSKYSGYRLKKNLFKFIER